MRVELSKSEFTFLQAQIARRLADVEDELVHTDARDLQAALADDANRLRALHHRLQRLLEESDVAA